MYAIPSICVQDFQVSVEGRNVVVLLRSTSKFMVSSVRADTVTDSITVLYSRLSTKNCEVVRQVVLQTPEQRFSHSGYS